ncbi:glycosyltransferase [Pedobacter lusitanus]|uniref:glycosyltransferase n=1 Tax=Pedobacter lusitanus TaxID=1503925 RepID=UPI000699026C|nr:glycosyltransferase [Pedobacter lusitanus]
MKCVDILLATYNGSIYLENQLLSLLSQTYKNWRLLIHDDGSNDNTLEIIYKYQKIDSRIILIEDEIKGNGAAYNFMHLLSLSESDLIVFCDQDDIWFENKLMQLVEGFNGEFDKPLAVFCNGYAYSEQRGIISDKITNVFPKDLNEQLFLNAGIQGCSLMFNRMLKQKLLPFSGFIVMHDHFITLGVLCFGELRYVDKSLMLYRQFHVNKVTANIEYSFAKRLKSIFISDIPVIDRRHKEAYESFYEGFKNELNQSQIDLFQAYFLYSRSGLLKRLLIVIVNRFKLYNSVLALLLKTITRKPIN